MSETRPLYLGPPIRDGHGKRHHLGAVVLVCFVAASLAGCVTVKAPSPIQTGLTGFIGLEFATSTNGGVPYSTPVAIWLASDEESLSSQSVDIRPLAGAIIETRVGSTLVGSTATDANGRWELPKRPEAELSITVLTPTGVFGVLAPAAVVNGMKVSTQEETPQPWPIAAQRVSREDILGGVAVTIEEARYQ